MEKAALIWRWTYLCCKGENSEWTEQEHSLALLLVRLRTGGRCCVLSGSGNFDELDHLTQESPSA